MGPILYRADRKGRSVQREPTVTRTASTAPAMPGSLRRALRQDSVGARRRMSMFGFEHRSLKPSNLYVSRGSAAV